MPHTHETAGARRGRRFWWFAGLAMIVLLRFYPHGILEAASPVLSAINPALSPDDLMIAYTTTAPGRMSPGWTLWLQDRLTGKRTILDKGPGNLRDGQLTYEWDTRGQFLCVIYNAGWFASTSTGYNWKAVFFDRRGHRHHQVSSHGTPDRCWFLAPINAWALAGTKNGWWDPDSKPKVKQDLWFRIEPGRPPKRIVVWPNSVSVYQIESVSKDGAYACAWCAAKNLPMSTSGLPRMLYIVNLRSGKVTKIPIDCAPEGYIETVWEPDGQHLIALRGEEGMANKLVRYDSVSGVSTDMTPKGMQGMYGLDLYAVEAGPKVLLGNGHTIWATDSRRRLREVFRRKAEGDSEIQVQVHRLSTGVLFAQRHGDESHIYWFDFRTGRTRRID